MAGVRMVHPTAKNCRFMISEPDKPYPSGAYQCTPPEFGGCGRMHTHKTHHLNVDEFGSTIVGDQLFALAGAHMIAAGFAVANEVLHPPTLGIGLAKQVIGRGPWGNIPIVTAGESNG